MMCRLAKRFRKIVDCLTDAKDFADVLKIVNTICFGLLALLRYVQSTESNHAVDQAPRFFTDLIGPYKDMLYPF